LWLAQASKEGSMQGDELGASMQHSTTPFLTFCLLVFSLFCFANLSQAFCVQIV
jgi:hypothetical protein